MTAYTLSQMYQKQYLKEQDTDLSPVPTKIETSKHRLLSNTFALYIRMIILMLINFYTIRIILNALGAEDFGIYNVVAGFVSLFSMFSNTLSTSIGRFFAYAIGENDKKQLALFYKASFIVIISIGLFSLLIAETIGLWFLNTKMTIPVERIVASNWVYQVSLAAFIMNFLNIPFHALIIAFEKMKAFAYIGIVEGLLSICVAFIVSIYNGDKLIAYSIAQFGVSVLLRLIYIIYCKKYLINFSSSNIASKYAIRKMIGFASWSFLESIAGIFRDQGINILLNIYFGPVVNAARGIAIHVNAAIGKFSSGFMTALSPQIIKSYANGAGDKTIILTFQGTRFSYYLMFILSVPVIVYCHELLGLWLGSTEVPNHTVLFVQLIILLSLIEVLSQPLRTLLLASGDIRTMQVIVSTLQMLNFPFSWILFDMGFFPEITVLCVCLISMMCLYVRLYLAKRLCGFSYSSFNRQVLFPTCSCSLLILIISLLIKHFMPDTLMNTFVGIVLCFALSLITIMSVGLSHDERIKLLYLLKIRKQ